MNSGMECWKKNLFEIYPITGIISYSKLNLWCECYWTSADRYCYWYFVFFGFIYIYFSLLSSVFILTQCAVTYWCSIISFTLSAQVSILNEYFIMMLFISIFTINLSCNDIIFCLFKILFVCWQWLLNRHYLKFK